MKATITRTGETITGCNLTELRSKLRQVLSRDGAYGLEAVTETGTTIHVEWIPSPVHDYIVTKDGRSLFRA